MLTKKIAVAALTLAVSAGASANLIMGGGFNDEADLDFWTSENLEGGNTAVTIGSAFGLGPQEGAGYLAFTGNSGSISSDYYGGLYQFVSLVTGREYALSYYWGGRGRTSTQDPTVSVSLTSDLEFKSADFLESTHQTNGNVGEWTQETVKFIATGGGLFVDLAEISSNSRGRGPALDNISLKEIPAPGSLALIGLGLVGLSSRNRRQM